MDEQAEIKMELHDLVLDHVKQLGFDVDSWFHSEQAKIGYDFNISHWIHVYTVIPGLHRMLVVEEKPHGGYIQFKGIPGFEAKLSIEDPDSLRVVGKILCDSYIWMKNINSKCVKELLNESQGFCSGTDIGNSR
jgi:hypothetical protein